MKVFSTERAAISYIHRNIKVTEVKDSCYYYSADSYTRSWYEMQEWEVV